MTAEATARTARDAMIEVPWLLHPDQPLREALLRMHDQGLTCAPVVDGVQVVGLLLVSDLPLRPRKQTHDRVRLAVRDRMSTTIPYLFEDDSLDVARAVAASTGAKHFCVLDRNHRLIGVVPFNGPNAISPERDEPGRVRDLPCRMAKVTPRAADTVGPGGYPAGPTLYFVEESPGALDR